MKFKDLYVGMPVKFRQCSAGKFCETSYNNHPLCFKCPIRKQKLVNYNIKHREGFKYVHGYFTLSEGKHCVQITKDIVFPISVSWLRPSEQNNINFKYKSHTTDEKQVFNVGCYL